MRPETITFAKGIPVKAFVRNAVQYPYHWHEALEIIYVMQGQVYIGMGAETRLLKENNIAVINRDELHRIYKSSWDNLLLIIQMDAAFYELVNPEYKYSFIYCCSPYHEAKVPEKYNKFKGYIAGLVDQLIKRSNEKDNEDVKSYLKKMLSYLTYNFDYLRFGPGIRAFDEKQVKRNRKMYEHIQKSPAGKTGLKELAEEAGITLYHLSHDIKEKFGLSFQELLHYSRCEQAARMLLGTNKQITKISAESGFSDPKYLIKHFKLNYQCTPSQFRKMHQADDETLASQVQYQEAALSVALEYLAPYNNL